MRKGETPISEFRLIVFYKIILRADWNLSEVSSAICLGFILNASRSEESIEILAEDDEIRLEDLSYLS